MKSLMLVLTTAAVCFGITAVTGFAGRTAKEPVFTVRDPFSALRAPALNLRCEYDSGAYGNSAPFLLCGRYVGLNVGGTTVLSPIGLVVRIRPGSMRIERYHETAPASVLATFVR